MAHIVDRHRRWPADQPKPRLRYRARYMAPNGQERSKCFLLKRDAEKFLNSMESSKADGSWTDPRRAHVAVGEWGQRYLESRADIKPKTRQSYDSLWRRCLLPTWEAVPLAKVTHLDVAEWVATMRARGLSPSRTRQAYHLLTGMLDAAVRDSRIPRNPAAGVDLPRLPKLDMRPLTHDQVHALADAAGPDDGLFLLVLAYCGLRYGEAAALRRRRVDVLRGRLEVAESLSEVGSSLTFQAPKTHQRRSVPIPRFLREPLGARLAGLAADDLVFTAPGGGPLRYSPWRRRVFDPATAIARLTGVKPHDLRHTCASLLIAQGAHPKAFSVVLGHSSIAVTMDRYGHLLPDALDDLGDSLDAAATAARTARPRHDLAGEVVPIRPTGS